MGDTLQEIKSTSKLAIVYTIGNIGTKLLGFVLIPLYTNTNYLSANDYGALAILEASLQVLVGLLTMAMSQSLARWYWDKKYSGQEKRLFFTTYSFLLGLILPITIVLISLSQNFSLLLFKSNSFNFVIKLTIATAAFQILNNQTLSLAKIQARSLLFTSFQIIKLAIVLGLILWGILVEGKGIEAIWIANLVGEAIVFITLIPYVLRNIEFKFLHHLLREMISYGLPLMVASVSSVLLATVDRYMLNSMSGLEKTAIYSLGFRIANTLKIIITSSLISALTPLRLKKLDEANNQRFYSKNLTYVGFIFMVALIGLNLFSMEFLKLFAHSPLYWKSNNIIPIISFALFFGLLKDFGNVGLYIKKRTIVLGILLVITSIINIILNLLLIPYWDIYGAAIATLISQVFFFITSVIAAHKVYPIGFEWRKIIIMTVISAGIIVISNMLSGLSLELRLVLKTLLFISFPFTLYLFHFYDKMEIENIKIIVSNWANLKKTKENLQRFLK